VVACPVVKWRATNLGGGHVRAPDDLIQRLEASEIERTGKALTAESWRARALGNGGPQSPATTPKMAMSQTTVSLARGYCHVAEGLNGCLRRQSVEVVRLAPSASVGLGQCVPPL
jgi:hypothetical protein